MPAEMWRSRAELAEGSKCKVLWFGVWSGLEWFGVVWSGLEWFGVVWSAFGQSFVVAAPGGSRVEGAGAMEGSSSAK